MTLHSQLFIASQEAARLATAAEHVLYDKAARAAAPADMPTEEEVLRALELRKQAVARLNEMLANMKVSVQAIRPAGSSPDRADTRA